MQKEKLEKTDNVDSYKLARTLKNGVFDNLFLFVPDRNLLDDRSVIRIRHQAVRDLARIKSRIKIRQSQEPRLRHSENIQSNNRNEIFGIPYPLHC